MDTKQTKNKGWEEEFEKEFKSFFDGLDEQTAVLNYYYAKFIKFIRKTVEAEKRSK